MTENVWSLCTIYKCIGLHTTLVNIEMAMTTRLDDTNQVGGDFRREPATGYGAGYLDSSAILQEKQATPWT